MDSNPTLSKMHQRMEETSAERAHRRSEDFGGVEQSVAEPVTPFGAARAATSSSLLSKVPLVGNLSSYLGAHNPLATEALPADTAVWLFDAVASRAVAPEEPGAVASLRRRVRAPPPPPWQAELGAAYFARDGGGGGGDVSTFVANIADEVGLSDLDLPDDEGERRIAERLRPFVTPIQPAKFVNVRLPADGGGEKVQRLGPGARNAISAQTVVGLGAEHKDGDVVQVPAEKEDVAPLGPARVQYAEPEGWLVISDIDDTVKVTLTPSPVGILTSTFISEPTPTPSMPELYAKLQTALGNPAWFYLSASPYNLYPFLRAFLHAHYPPGPLLLRQTSWMDPAGLLASLTQGTQAYKEGQVARVRAWLPRRKALCVGDSTQSDPEAYGAAYRKYGAGWVRGIWIRKVTGVAGMDEEAKNAPRRFEKAFEGVPRAVWRVFETGAELEGALDDLVAEK